MVSPICQHLGTSLVTGKKIKSENNNLTAIPEHLSCCNYSPRFKGFSLLTIESTGNKLKIIVSQEIERHSLVLNTVYRSIP